jgi:hypothetical protein
MEAKRPECDPAATNHGQNLTAYMKQHIPRSFIEAPESEKLENLADKVGEIYEGCRIRGGYTEAAFEFLDSYDRRDGDQNQTTLF